MPLNYSYTNLIEYMGSYTFLVEDETVTEGSGNCVAYAEARKVEVGNIDCCL